jgi:hypothetical protein
MTFPLETLPPGDPIGGVVYLRIILSPEEASRIYGTSIPVNTFTSCNNAYIIHLTVMNLDHTLSKFNYQKLFEPNIRCHKTLIRIIMAWINTNVMLLPVNIMHINFQTLQVILTDINYE